MLFFYFNYFKRICDNAIFESLKTEIFKKVYRLVSLMQTNTWSCTFLENHTERNRIGISKLVKVGNSVIRHHHLTRLPQRKLQIAGKTPIALGTLVEWASAVVIR